ncbi:hypothetical protein ACFST9_11660 [Hymenobacter monticola]|uniref:DUF2029 domain-containing protein n=1 Tax=Hymenobacter monticola TaxID=1705399 RepID=A0ABY4B7J5_9BACT|nr:hypothetical protein [Hymenobacter monticola]UOE35152.1 hypothetical protein MTP16_05750 [Hymenobacter monticola]
MSSFSSSFSFLKRYPAVAAVGVHLLLLTALASALYCFGVIRYLPDDANVARWDVQWYTLIRDGGYTYSDTGMSPTAFFPLFPYVWRWTHLNNLHMGMLNYGLFVVAFGCLAQQLRLPARWTLLLLSTPVLLFMVIPYTEALFFVFSTLLVLGLHRQRMSWWLLGLLGAGLTRSASTLFLPALLFMALLWAAQPGQARRAALWGGLGLLANGLSIGVVAFIQWYQVGEPFAFVKAQAFWGRHLRWPEFPLNTPSGINVLWLDALALWTGVMAICACCWLALRWLQRNKRPLPAVPPVVVFALGYCVSVTLYLLSYQGGSIWNFARYVLATPFFVVLVWYLGTQPAWPRRYYLYILAATLALWQVFGAYTLAFDNFTRGQALWYFGLVTAYLFAYLTLRQFRWQREVSMLLYVFNLVVQLHLLECFLQYYVVQ